MTSAASLMGTFAYKFSGFALLQTRPFFLTGLGHFQIDAAGHLTGAHPAAIMAIQGQDSEFDTTSYTLRGTINLKADGTGEANIRFTSTGDGKGKNVDDKFSVVLAGNADRLWLISTDPRVPETGERANELVNIEAVRITA
jgi:hypothetical protein